MPQVTTTFIAGAAGFIGTELVKPLVARGHQVVGLGESVDAATHLRCAGAVAVIWTLLGARQWQDEAAADWVFHLPPRPVCAGSFAIGDPGVDLMPCLRKEVLPARSDPFVIDEAEKRGREGGCAANGDYET